MVFQEDFEVQPIKENGSYFLCLIYISSGFDLGNKIFNSVKKFYNEFTSNNYMMSNGYVIFPEKILQHLTNFKWMYEFSLRIKTNFDYIIGRAQLPNNYHFVLLDKNGSVIYNPSKNLLNKNFYFKDFRLFKCLS